MIIFAVVAETSRTLQKTEDRLKKMSRERDDLENAIDKLRETLEATEQTKKKLHHQVSYHLCATNENIFRENVVLEIPVDFQVY